jgi:ribosomal protein L7/L12
MAFDHIGFKASIQKSLDNFAKNIQEYNKYIEEIENKVYDLKNLMNSMSNFEKDDDVKVYREWDKHLKQFKWEHDNKLYYNIIKRNYDDKCQNLQAIKQLREHTGWGLLNIKNYVEYALNTMGLE